MPPIFKIRKLRDHVWELSHWREDYKKHVSLFRASSALRLWNIVINGTADAERNIRLARRRRIN